MITIVGTLWPACALPPKVDAGSITIDDHDIRTYQKADLRRQLALKSMGFRGRVPKLARGESL